MFHRPNEADDIPALFVLPAAGPSFCPSVGLSISGSGAVSAALDPTETVEIATFSFLDCFTVLMILITPVVKPHTLAHRRRVGHFATYRASVGTNLAVNEACAWPR